MNDPGVYMVTIERPDGDEWIWRGEAGDAEDALTFAKNDFNDGKGIWQ